MLNEEKIIEPVEVERLHHPSPHPSRRSLLFPYQKGHLALADADLFGEPVLRAVQLIQPAPQRLGLKPDDAPMLGLMCNFTSLLDSKHSL